MKARNSIIIYALLVAASAIFLFIQWLTHFEFMFHLAAIPIEVLVAVFVINIYLENRQSKEKRQKLARIMSWMWRLEMRNLAITACLALKSPAVNFSKMKAATLTELRRMREEANTIEFESPEAMETVLQEYVNAQTAFRNIIAIAFDYDFEDVFQDVEDILHLISDVETFKENNPGKLFIHEAVKNDMLMQRVMRVLGDSCRMFLDVLIELKEKQPELFNQLMSDYELSAQLRG